MRTAALPCLVVVLAACSNAAACYPQAQVAASDVCWQHTDEASCRSACIAGLQAARRAFATEVRGPRDTGSDC